MGVLQRLEGGSAHGRRSRRRGRLGASASSDDACSFRDGDGNSTEPAPDDLVRYATHYEAATGSIAITIPDFALHIESISVHQLGENGHLRLKLAFPATYGAVYEICYQPDLASPLRIAPFSLTACVDAVGPRGFFVVGVKLTEIF